MFGTVTLFTKEEANRFTDLSIILWKKFQLSKFYEKPSPCRVKFVIFMQLCPTGFIWVEVLCINSGKVNVSQVTVFTIEKCISGFVQIPLFLQSFILVFVLLTGCTSELSNLP